VALLLPLAAFDTEVVCRELRRAHPRADHRPWAVRWTAGQEAADDDGEPAGTAGAAILALLRERGVERAALGVARYFGGVKLGRAGLWRAFRAAAEAVVEAAELAAVRPTARVTATLNYAEEPAWRRVLADIPHREAETTRGAVVRWAGWVVDDPAVRRALAAVLRDETRLVWLPDGEGIL
jgi:putative IMPACT (imprinted ancient) family translation regulator